MTEENTSSTAGQPGSSAEGASEEDLRNYLAQIRSVPADQLVTDVLSSVLTAGQAKLGRKDGRLMIDLSALILDHVRPHLPEEPAEQLDQVLGQLRLAQVQAEAAVAQQSEEEPNDLSDGPRPPSGESASGAEPAGATPSAQPEQPSGQTQQPPSRQTPQQSPASKLWVPGRP